MNQQQIILVTGATGAQGGSVAKALLQHKKFAVRILTRDKNADKAISLHKAGAEVVEGDFNDMDSLIKAMQGVYGVFGVTNFWEHYEKEYVLGKNLIDAVHQCGVKHFVFSALDNYHRLSNYALPVPHYDIKASLREYAKSLHLPATFVHLAFYYENFINFFPLQKNDEGSLYFGFPQGDSPLAAVSVEDLGGIVAAVFNYPTQYIGRTVGVVGDALPCAAYAAIMSDVLQQPVQYNYIPREVYAKYPFPGAEDLANMFEVQRLYIPGYQLNIIESYGLNPSMQSFKSWMGKNKELFSPLIDVPGQVMEG